MLLVITKWSLLFVTFNMLGKCTYKILSFITVTMLTGGWLQVIWIAYGHVIYFSKKNDCFHVEDTKYWCVLMIILLFIGILTVLPLIILTVLCCFFGKQLIEWLNSESGVVNEDQRESYAQGLKSILFDPKQFDEHNNSCSICLCDFADDPDCKVTKLDCSHAFHTECLQENIKQGTHWSNLICPNCKKPINLNDDEKRELMMMR